MFMEERHSAIVEQLRREGKVEVHELSQQFRVTEDCIRKDLSTLEKQGLLKRTYGGAVPLLENFSAQDVAKRRHTDIKPKRKIAKAALTLIKDKEMVFLDVSTSNLALAELFVAEERELTVVTNMLDIMIVLARNPKINLISVGGIINKSRDGFWGGTTSAYLKKFKPDIAFLGTVGVDTETKVVSCRDLDDGINKEGLVKAAKRVYVMAENKKFFASGNYNYASLQELDGIVTDTLPPEKDVKALQELGVALVMPEHDAREWERGSGGRKG